MTSLRKIAGGLAVLAVFSAASAQDAPTPTQQGTPTQGTANSQKAKPAAPAKSDNSSDQGAEKTEKAKPNLPTVDLGYADWGLSGNRTKFQQYATPANGFFLRRFYYNPYSTNLRYSGFADIRVPGEPDYRLSGGLQANYGASVLQATNYRNRFYDPSDFLEQQSERQISEALFKQKFNQNLAFTLTAKADQQDSIFPAPQDPLHQRTRVWNGRLEGKVGRDDYASLNLTDFHYWDRTQVEPEMHATQLNFSYLHQFLSNLGAYGSYTDTLLHQPSFSDSNIQSWGLGGNWDITPDTGVMFDWNAERLSLPNVANAYDQSRILSRAKIVHHFGTWTAQFGYNELDLQRVNGNHTFIDSPSYHTFDVQLNGQFTPWLRLDAYAYRQSLEGSVTMETSDPLALYWRNVSYWNVKLNAFANSLDGYAIFSGTDENNSARDTNVHNKILTCGASWQTKPDFSLYVEGTSNWWSAHSGDPQATQLGLFFPNADDVTFGANWNVNSTLTATANYTQIWDNNRNPLYLADGNFHGQFFTVGGTVRARNGNVYGVTFAPWTYSDKVDPLRNYNTALVTVSARIQF